MEILNQNDIVDFWFSPEASERWFQSTPEFDQMLRERFDHVWQQAKQGELEDWMETAKGCLALVIVLDQLPLNMFRGEALSFFTEAQARDVAQHAIQRGFDQAMPTEQKSFLYLPFMHSEDLADQERALELYNQPGLETNRRFAQHHHGIVNQFGRFPHRNDVLGRVSTEAEVEYLNSNQAFTG